MVVFSSGNWLSGEAFQELGTPIAPRGVSRNTAPDPVALVRHWLDVHALGHLALLSFRGELAWFAEMLQGGPSDVIELARSPNRISAKGTVASRWTRRRSIHRTFCSSVTSLTELVREISLM
jgi:hypothetical protein